MTPPKFAAKVAGPKLEHKSSPTVLQAWLNPYGVIQAQIGSYGMAQAKLAPYGVFRAQNNICCWCR